VEKTGIGPVTACLQGRPATLALIPKLSGQPPRCPARGECATRTRGLIHAMDALYQLS
jgi:hypothetical protein